MVDIYLYCLILISYLQFICIQFQMVKNLHITMSELVNEHKRTYDDDTMRNLTDVYLKQIKESNDPNFNGINNFHKRTYVILLSIKFKENNLTSKVIFLSISFRGTINGDINGSLSCRS